MAKSKKSAEKIKAMIERMIPTRKEKKRVKKASCCSSCKSGGCGCKSCK